MRQIERLFYLSASYRCPGPISLEPNALAKVPTGRSAAACPVNIAKSILIGYLSVL